VDGVKAVGGTRSALAVVVVAAVTGMVVVASPVLGGIVVESKSSRTATGSRTVAGTKASGSPKGLVVIVGSTASVVLVMAAGSSTMLAGATALVVWPSFTMPGERITVVVSLLGD
jgi:hypothetical protein